MCSSIKDNKDIVLAFLDASETRNQEAMKALLHPDVQVIEAASLPYGGIAKGPDAFIKLIKQVFSTWKDIKLSVQKVLSDGDYVILLAEMSVRNQTTEKMVVIPIAEIWRLNDGKIIEVRPFYFDTKLLLEARVDIS